MICRSQSNSSIPIYAFSKHSLHPRGIFSHTRMHSLSTHNTRRGIFNHSRMHSLSTHYSRRGIFSHSRMHYLNTNYTRRGIFNHSRMHSLKTLITPVCISNQAACNSPNAHYAHCVFNSEVLYPTGLFFPLVSLSVPILLQSQLGVQLVDKLH
jgi:hypothetical protein